MAGTAGLDLIRIGEAATSREVAVSSPASSPVSPPTSLPPPTPNQKSSSTQTFQDNEVALSNLNKISKLDEDLSKMDHNQDLLLSELYLQKKDNFALQEEITMMKNNLYHVSLLEQNCSLPPQLSPHQMSPPTTPTVSTAKEDQDTKTIKKDLVINKLPENYPTATLFPLKEDPTQPLKKEANKNLN